RLGDRPRVLIATTPRTTPFMKKLVAMDDVRITTGSTYDNAAHLSADFLKKVRELYEGTRLGRQELQGAMILDPMNALFKDDWLTHDEVAEDLIEQVTVGVDPSGGGDEVGIVASACSRMAGSRCWPTGPRPAARRSGARPWCAAMMTSTPTTLWSKSTSAATWQPKWSSRPPNACTSAAGATRT